MNILIQALNLAPGACAELCACTKNQHTVPLVATSLNRTTASSVVPLSAFSSPWPAPTHPSMRVPVGKELYSVGRWSAATAVGSAAFGIDSSSTMIGCRAVFSMRRIDVRNISGTGTWRTNVSSIDNDGDCTHARRTQMAMGTTYLDLNLLSRVAPLHYQAFYRVLRAWVGRSTGESGATPRNANTAIFFRLGLRENLRRAFGGKMSGSILDELKATTNHRHLSCQLQLQALWGLQSKRRM
jgi:hypothetical protein